MKRVICDPINSATTGKGHCLLTNNAHDDQRLFGVVLRSSVSTQLADEGALEKRQKAYLEDEFAKARSIAIRREGVAQLLCHWLQSAATGIQLTLRS